MLLIEPGAYSKLGLKVRSPKEASWDQSYIYYTQAVGNNYKEVQKLQTS